MRIPENGSYSTETKQPDCGHEGHPIEGQLRHQSTVMQTRAGFVAIIRDHSFFEVFPDVTQDWTRP